MEHLVIIVLALSTLISAQKLSIEKTQIIVML